jgi:hypothetical protein
VVTPIDASAVGEEPTPDGSQNVEPPVINNILINLGGPEPIYPRQVGFRHPEDPLPMMPRIPKKYYNIYRGLKIGVFYDVWYAIKLLCCIILNSG